MYQIGDYIVYAAEGVCRVAALGVPEIPCADRNRLYYFLQPLSRFGTIYIPVDSEVFMRPVMTREAALNLIDRIPLIEEAGCAGLNNTDLAQRYRASLASHDCADLVQLIKTVYARKQAAVSMGRKPGKVDMQAMSRAEDLLHDELSVALAIPREQVQPFIERRVRALEPQPQPQR